MMVLEGVSQHEVMAKERRNLSEEPLDTEEECLVRQRPKDGEGLDEERRILSVEFKAALRGDELKHAEFIKNVMLSSLSAAEKRQAMSAFAWQAGIVQKAVET